MCVNAGSNHWNHGPPTLRSAGETAFVDAQGERASRLGSRTDACRGIVAKVDLTLAEVGEVLDAHQAAAPRRLKGVRHVGLWVEGMAGTFSNKALYDSPAFRRGFAQLAERRLCFDALVAHTQLEQVARLAADFPHAAIILDHFGLPIGVGAYAGRRHDAYNEWFDLIASVAACPNVSIKLGGLNSPVSGFDWHLRSAPPSSAELAEAISPYFVRAVALFGPERCMFESNWPVDGLSSSYHVLWNAFKRLGAGLSIEARHAMFHGNANRIYQLGLSVRGS
jgi:predicted TIM-barrel fold metal-dependent hydrolase